VGLDFTFCQKAALDYKIGSWYFNMLEINGESLVTGKESVALGPRPVGAKMVNVMEEYQ
jgi:hypothetical protein